jgi:hypothetical protein
MPVDRSGWRLLDQVHILLQENSMPAPFLRRKGDDFVPTPDARGPWGDETMHGRVVAGLLGRTIEQEYGDREFQFSRLTVDMFRMPKMAPMQVGLASVRAGNRIRVVDGVVTQDGAEIARARGVLLRRGEAPVGNVWRAENWDVPAPGDIAEAVPSGPPGRAPMWEMKPISGGFGQLRQKRAWLRENRELVEGEALTPFVRVAVSADFASPFANSGDQGLQYVNADITLYLHRDPVGEWIGFEVTDHMSADGVCLGECALYDEQGRLGRSLVCGVANRR